MKKSEIIYKRLREEFEDFKNWDQFADKFGVSRQAINERRKKGEVDINEIRRVFPDVNTSWLLSENEAELKSLPVKKKFTGSENARAAEGLVKKYESRKSLKEASDKERDILIEYLRAQAESLSEGLRRLSELERNRD